MGKDASNKRVCKRCLYVLSGMFLSLTFNFATIFLIGLYFSMEFVAGFDVALKIVLVAIIPFDILQQAVYPTVTRNKDKKLIRRLIALSFLAGIVLMVLLYSFSESLLGIFGGTEMIKYKEVLQVLSVMVPFSAHIYPGILHPAGFWLYKRV